MKEIKAKYGKWKKIKTDAIAKMAPIAVFGTKEELIKTLKSLSKDQLLMVGYVDDNDIVRHLKKSDLFRK